MQAEEDEPRSRQDGCAQGTGMDPMRTQPPSSDAGTPVEGAPVRVHFGIPAHNLTPMANRLYQMMEGALPGEPGSPISRAASSMRNTTASMLDSSCTDLTLQHNLLASRPTVASLMATADILQSTNARSYPQLAPGGAFADFSLLNTHQGLNACSNRFSLAALSQAQDSSAQSGQSTAQPHSPPDSQGGRTQKHAQPHRSANALSALGQKIKKVKER